VNPGMWLFMCFCPFVTLSCQPARDGLETGEHFPDSIAMNHSKRHNDIIRLLQQHGTVTIAELAKKLDVSLETVRRDIRPLTDN
ncbi:DeoR family transcriptional regulator, partial [Streptococcus pyogenes]